MDSAETGAVIDGRRLRSAQESDDSDNASSLVETETSSIRSSQDSSGDDMDTQIESIPIALNNLNLGATAASPTPSVLALFRHSWFWIDFHAGRIYLNLY